MMLRNLTASKIAVVCIVSLLIFTSDGGASSVRNVSLDEMIQQSQFVFEGRAFTIEATEDSPKRIYTYVTFEILEVIKGEYPKSTITLRFLGGTVGDVTMTVSDMQVPQLGEHGIYFVESLERLQLHPLYGWSQGHFIVERDETGVDRVLTNRKQSFVSLESNRVEAQTSPGEDSFQPLSSGVAQGLVVVQKNNITKGLSTNEFKNILKKKLGKGQ